MAAMLCALALCGPIHGEPAHGGHALLVSRGGQAVAETPIETGERLARAQGWVREQWVCLYRLWSRESGWRVESVNRSGSGATGIPQALPGSKMASAGSDWRTSAATQIRWGIGYINARYHGSPCEALAHSDATGFY